MNTALLRQFAALHDRKARLETEIDEIKVQLAQLEPMLMDEFSQESVNKMTVTFPVVLAPGVDGAAPIEASMKATIYLERKLWCKIVDGDTPRAIAALKAAGDDWAVFVKEGFNSNTLSARLRESEKAGDPLPAALAGAIETSEVFSLRVRRT